MLEESPESRQNNEFEALQAIYDQNLHDLRKKRVWNIWHPLDLSITLTPQQGSLGTQAFHVQVDLHVKCDEKYPESVPELLLEKSKGLSDALLFELQDLLDQKAKELVGDEMIFQLAQVVEEFLHKHNKPTSKSFYDEMVKMQKEKEMKDQQLKKMELDKKRQYIREEVQKREEILKSEAKKWRETKQNSENESDSDDRRSSLHSRKQSSTETSDDFICDHKTSVIIQFGIRTIRRGGCIKHSSSNYVIYPGIDTESGEFMLINEWSFHCKNKNDLQQIQKQLESLEQEMNYLMKHKHGNIGQFYGIKNDIDGDNVTVYVFKEFIIGINCYSIFIDKNIKIDIDYLKYIARGILTGLDYLHRNNIVHKDIKDSCIFVNNDGLVQISNYSIYRRLLDLTIQTNNCYSKKTDIFRFGLIVLSLLQGYVVSEENLEISDKFSPELYDFLTRCLDKEENKRFTATQLLRHSFLKTPPILFSPKHVNDEFELEQNSFPEIITDLQVPRQHSIDGQSRINIDFEFLQHLGKGAYGDVLKFKNKLDGGYYAIKRIKLNPKNKVLYKKIIKEVKLLSRLNHENVVRYFNSWIETTTIKGDMDTVQKTTSTEKKKNPKIIPEFEFTWSDNIEALAPSINISYNSKFQTPYVSLSDDESSDEDEELSGGM